MAKSKYNLRDMTPTDALVYCANLTLRIWSKMESGDVLELWTMFQAYILNGFRDTGTPVPDRLVSAWDICKYIIDKEAGTPPEKVCK